MRRVITGISLLLMVMWLAGCWDGKLDPGEAVDDGGSGNGGSDDAVSDEGESEDPGDPGDNPVASEPEIGDVDRSACKPGTVKNARLKDEAPGGSSEMGVIDAIVNDDYATIIHRDAFYQCDAEIIFSLQVIGTRLILTEYENVNVITNCMCRMDLAVDLLNLERDVTYHVEVWDEAHEVLFGEVDIRIEDCGPQMCVTSWDCYHMDLPHPRCPGYWTCVDGVCEYVCDNDMTCRDDSDCPEGYQCVWRDEPWPGDPDQEGRPGHGHSGEGHSGGRAGSTDMDDRVSSEADVDESGRDKDENDFPPTDPELYCESDRDCPPGMWCEFIDCFPGEDCYPFGICVGDFPPPPPFEGVCEPIEWECDVAEDCYGYPEPMDGGSRNGGPANDASTDAFLGDCIGSWDCIDHQCVYVCEPFECFDDSDCPSGYHCEFRNGLPEDTDGETRPGGSGSSDPSTGDPDNEMPYWGGICVPNYYDTCEDLGGFCFPFDDTGNRLCPPGTAPIVEALWNEPLCGPGAVCCVPLEEPPITCWADYDCPPGMFCINGICENVCPPVAIPDCPPGYELVCWFDEMGCEYCECVFAGEAGCMSSADCGPGEYCSVEDGECLPPPGCGPDMECPAVCYGRCVPIDDCVCAEYYAPVCGVDGVTYGNECFAGCAGVEIAHPGPCNDPYECNSDADCPRGQYCDLCPPDPSCPMCDVCGPPVCVAF